jgi:8-oxo-dGTP pyrophosphatase MutT (NUDIX family)
MTDPAGADGDEPTHDHDTAEHPRRASGRARLETSAGGVVYRVHDGVPLFLLIRDSYRNWGFPKGHLEHDELPDAAAMREVREETGLDGVSLNGEIDTIDWFFRFRGRLVHKVCHFFLMRTDSARTKPQRAEGITACRWATFDEASQLVSYANARDVLMRAHAMVQADASATDISAAGTVTPEPAP